MAGVLRERQLHRTDRANTAISEKVQQTSGNNVPVPPVKKPKKCFQKGMRVWVADNRTESETPWLQATVTGPGTSGKVTVQLDGGEILDVSRKADSILLAGDNNYIEVDDLTKLSPLNEAEVLQSLQCRFRNAMVCSRAGITLISINPFKEIAGLYDDAAIQSYHKQEGVLNDAPHVFAVAEKAFSSLRYAVGCPNQSIIVSGESGAGKTWNTRCLMKYLTSVSLYKNPGGVSPPTVKSIERRILHSNPILEAFGNAGTARNHNSSRFGKYIQLQFDRGCYIVGASIQTYLLEKTRVVHQAEGERNFHIFYQILSDASDEEREEWGVASPIDGDTDFAYLPLDNVECEPANEEQGLAVTQRAMNSVGLTKRHQINVFQVLCGILHLGNLEFVSDEEFDPCELDEEECEVSLDYACRLLGLDRSSLITSLTFRRITASHSKRQSVFMKPCSVDEAGVRRDCVSKVIYARVFEWLVAFLNKHTSANQWHSFVGLLDIYGFESFASNSLEQLCINYANEKLQQHFVAHFLRAEQEVYKQEGLSWQFCNFVDNQPCVETIEGKLSVFSLMNEECRLNRQSDPTSFEDKLLASVDSPFLTKAPMGHPEAAFTIRHYAGTVTYDTHGLIEKTKDPIPIELLEVLQASTNPFVSQIIKPELERTKELQSKGSSKASVSKTVVSRFKESLASLMRTLNSTTPHYIRCIKPNPHCQPDLLDSCFVASQLKACGVLETIAISAAGFPAKLSHAEFCQRYGMLIPGQELNSTLPAKERCRLLHSHLFGTEDKENDSGVSTMQQLGRTKIFLKEGQLEYLESMRVKRLSQCATVIQRAWRLHMAMVEGQREWAATIIQAGYHGWKVRQAMQIMNDAARVIQHAMFMYCIKKRRERTLTPDLEEDQTEELESPRTEPKPPRKSVHFASNLATVREIYSPSPVPSPSATPTPCQPSKLVFTENSTHFDGLSTVDHHHGNSETRKTAIKESDGDPVAASAASGAMKEEDADATGRGAVATVTNLLRKPAVDVAIVGAIAVLLFTGPLRWN